jgi:tetratricopeptide (TPR) repeat protein
VFYCLEHWGTAKLTEGQNILSMSRRTIAIASALSVLALGSPLITGCANDLATNSLNSGVEKYEQGDYQGAIDDWSKAIEIDPRQTLAYYNRGNAKYF